MNRRDLLKLFGAGAIVVPAASKLDIDTPMARIIEPPKVELVEASALQNLQASALSAVPFGEMRGVLILQAGQMEYTVHCHCVHTTTRKDWIDVYCPRNAHVSQFGAKQLHMSFDVIADPVIKSRPKVRA